MQMIAVHPKKPWTAFECFLFGVLGACAVLLIVLPILVGLPLEVIGKALDGQMVPWNI